MSSGGESRGVDDYVKGIAVALLTDQVDEKTGYVAKLGEIVLAVCVLVVIMAEGWWQWPAAFLVVLSLMFLAFVWVTKRGPEIGRLVEVVEGLQEPSS